MKLQYSLFHRSNGDQAVDHDWPILADSVGAVCCLILDRRIPPGVEEKNVICRGQVEADPAGLEGNQHDRRAIWGLKLVDRLLSNPCFAI